MSLDAKASASPTVTGLGQLVEWLRAGEKPVGQRRVGIETEKLGVVEATGGPAPIAGERSIGTVLTALAKEDGGRLLVENETPIGIELPASSVALEPGGQLELSGEAATHLEPTVREIGRHLALVRRFSRDAGLAFLAVGYRPFGPREAVPWLPRGRYGLMREKLPGRLAHDMMQMTASVQANFDFSSEAELAEQVACATAVSPVVTALFANSPFVDGRPSGHRTMRYRVWQEVDPARSGLLRFMFEPGFSYRRYVEWALGVPLLFVRRGGAYRDPGGRTFRDLMQGGFEGEPASMQDFVDLLSTLFPEIRVKHVVEVRGADAVDQRTTAALPALWTALLYDVSARRDARALVRASFDELLKFQRDVATDALFARLGPARAVDLARELLRLADDALRRRQEAGLGDDRPLLDPLREIAESERTGADRLLELHAKTNGDVQALVEAMRY